MEPQSPHLLNLSLGRGINISIWSSWFSSLRPRSLWCSIPASVWTFIPSSCRNVFFIFGLRVLLFLLRSFFIYSFGLIFNRLTRVLTKMEINFIYFSGGGGGERGGCGELGVRGWVGAVNFNSLVELRLVKEEKILTRSSTPSVISESCVGSLVFSSSGIGGAMSMALGAGVSGNGSPVSSARSSFAVSIQPSHSLWNFRNKYPMNFQCLDP